VDVASGAICPEKILIKERSMSPLIIAILMFVASFFIAKIFNENVFPNHGKSIPGFLIQLFAYGVSIFAVFKLVLSIFLSLIIMKSE